MSSLGHGYRVPLSSFGPIGGGSLVWEHKGTLSVTVVLRIAFAVAAGPLAQVSPGPIELVDLHYQSDPARPVRTLTDLAPRVPRAEIMHAGAVVAPGGVTMVRLGLIRQGKPVFDKRALASAKNDSPALGPLGPTSPARSALLRGKDPPKLDARGVLAIPDDFDFAYYQGAPADQQADALVGGDQILLGNLHPELPELALLIPSRAPAARAVLGGEEAPLLLECKRVVIDTDRRTYALIFYAELELPGFEVLPHLRIEARAPEAAPPPQFDSRQMLQRIAGAPGAAAKPQGGPVRMTGAGTVVVDSAPPPLPNAAGTLIVGDDAPAAAPAVALPFAASGPSGPSASRSTDLSATPWGADPLKSAQKPIAASVGTMALDVDEPGHPALAAPRPPAPPAPPPPIAPAPPPSAPELNVGQASKVIAADSPLSREGASREAPPPREGSPGKPGGSPWAPPAASEPAAPKRPAPAPPPPAPAAAGASKTLKKGLYDKFLGKK